MFDPRHPCRSAAAIGLRLAFAAGITAASTAQGVIVEQFRADRHIRWESAAGGAENPGFVIFEHVPDADLSGIAANKPATMITPRHFVTAFHAWNRNQPGSLEFRNARGETVTIAVDHFDRIRTTTPGFEAASDVCIGTLAHDVPADAGVAVYPIIAEEDLSYLRSEMFVYGSFGTAGRNRIEEKLVFAFNPTKPNYTWVVSYTYDTFGNGGRTNSVTSGDEAGLVSGDSGWPALIHTDAGLAVVGCHMAVDGAAPSRYGSYTSFLPAYIDQIESVVSAEGHSILGSGSTPPEPCIADVDGSGQLDVADVIAFYDAKRMGLPSADLDGNTRIDIFDIIEFHRLFALGCADVAS